MAGDKISIVDEWYAPGAPGSYGHLFTAEAQQARDDELRERFSSGNGVIALNNDAPDVVVLSVIRFALSASAGRPFTVVSSVETGFPKEGGE